MNECGCATPAAKRVAYVQMKDIEIEIRGVKEELSRLKSKLEKVELQLETGTDAKGSLLSSHDRERLERKEEALNNQIAGLTNQIAGLQEEKNLLLKKQMGMLPPPFSFPLGDRRALCLYMSLACILIHI